jgi:hypothetical protein
MPDIKSALAKALDEWSREEETQFKQPEEKQMDARSNMPQTFKTTNNITRMTFNYVRDNPGLTAKQVGEHVASLGLKAHSAIAMMSASVGCGMMRRDEHSRYYTTMNEYRPIKKPKPKGTSSAGIAALPVKRVEKKVERVERVIPIQQPTASTILGTLNVVEAKKLYQELRVIFEG